VLLYSENIINITYDAFGPPAAFIRGMFEYLYRADGVTLVPHIPPGISELQQADPIRFGNKKLFLSTVGHGPITSVTVNSRHWRSFDSSSVFLAYNQTPDVARIVISLGGGTPSPPEPVQTSAPTREAAAEQAIGESSPALVALEARAAKVRAFHARLVAAGFGESYEAAHAQLILDAVRTVHQRHSLLAAGRLAPLPEPSRVAADKSYEDTAARLLDGLATVMKSYRNFSDPGARKILQFYVEAQEK
jgi:hypothetical protein